MRPSAALLRVFVVLALLVRLAVPAGFMPMADAHGRVSIILCPGVTAAATMPHHGGGKAQHQKEGDAAKPCAFALSLAPATDPPLADTPQPPSVPVTALRLLERASTPGRGLAAPPPPATGPPLPA